MRTLICVVLILATVLFLSVSAFSEGRKGILLSTVDISIDYEVIGIVYARTGSTDIRDLNDELIKRAAKAGADAVIGIRYLPYIGYLYVYGTAVEFKE